MPNALTIAGSDSVGGAGLQADMKAFEALGVHGCSVVTCVTSQNTKGVSSIFPIPAEEVASQLRSVLEDVELGAVKTGMLYSPDIVRTVGELLRAVEAPIVVDPVMAATTGSRLHVEGFVDVLTSELIPICALVTPNTREAEMLSGVKVKDAGSAKKAATRILALGPGAVLLKGGHLKGPDAADYLCTESGLVKITSPRLPVEVHGTGCALGALIAGKLALGADLEDAVRGAKSMIFKAILARETVGMGVPCANPLAVLRAEAAKMTMLTELEDAACRLEELMDATLLPEVGSNIGYGVLGAVDADEVAALEGRIVRCGDRARRTGCARFGASKHVARIVLAASSVHPEVRCAMNVKLSQENISACRRAGLSVASFDRAREPKGVSSMTWGVLDAIGRTRGAPDVIFDRGGVGKEPMIRLLGRSPEEVVLKLERMVSSRSEG